MVVWELTETALHRTGEEILVEMERGGIANRCDEVGVRRVK